MVQASLSTSTNFDGDLNALVEDQNNALTVRFDLDEPAPTGGLKVYIDSDTEQIVNRLDLPGFAFSPTTENINPTTFGTNLDNSGIVLTIDEGATFGTFSINIFDNPEPDTFLPETFDGRVDALFSLKTQDQIDPADQNDINGLSDYTIDANAASSTVIFVDEASQLVDPPQPPTEPSAPPAPAQPMVSLHTGPTTLIESENTVSAHVFNVTGLPLPTEGLVISVSAPNLGEFDLSAIEVIDGEIVAVRDDGFDLRLTDYTTLVNLPIAEDGVAEGLDSAIFTLEAGDGYVVNSDLSGGRFNLADTAADAPAGGHEPDDTIDLAIETGLSVDNPSVTFSNELDFDIGNRYQNEDGSFTYIDATEDVDFYKVSLSEGDIVAFDVDAVVKGDQEIANLMRDRTQASVIFRLFDAEGNELAARDSGQGPGELFATSTDPYLEFQATEAGDYYLGLSVFSNGVPYRFGGDQFGNAQQYIERTYDPFVPASGDGDARGGLDFRGLGGYDLEITLNPENPLMLAEQRNRSNNTVPTDIDRAAPGEPTVSLDFISATYSPDDDLIDDNLVEGLENQGSILTLIIETEGEIPPEGILVTVNSDTYLRDYYTVRTLLAPPFTPGAELVDVVTDDTGRETGVQLRVFSPKTFLPLNARTQLRGEVIPLETDGPETATFFIEGGEGYGASESNNITATFYDTAAQAPAPTVIPEVSLAISEPVLVESEGTETTFTFTLSEPPPAEGVVVYAKAQDPLLGRFDVLNADIAGGTFPFPNGDFNGFYFKITEQEASITLRSIENSLTEGLVTYDLSLQPAPFYSVNEAAASVRLTVGDTPESIVIEPPPEPSPILEEFGPNDTIPEAVPLPFRSEGETIRGGLLPREEGIERADYRDFSEDVDFYSFELAAGETATIDVNAIPFELPRFPGVEQTLDSELRLFDEAGNELVSVNNAAPGEDYSRDPYLEFTATTAGIYYIGISQLGNRDYDPFEARSGSGWVFPEIGVFSGEYDLSVNVTSGNNLPSSTLPDRVITALNDALDSNLPAEVPGAAVAILTPEGEWFGASGVSNVAENTPLQPGDRFEAGSITKTFVATTLLQLVEENQLSLTDTLTDWLPTALTDLVPNASEITIEQILGHTSGIADYLDILAAQALSNPTLFLEDWQPEALIGFIDGVEPFFAPGESWQYSNTNYILAGSVIEAVTGNRYGQEIRDRILDPLELDNTFVFGEEEVPGGYIKSYWDFDSNGTLDDLSITNLSWTGSAGSIISNTEDLADFFDGLLVDGALLEPKTLEEMLDTMPVDSPNYDEYGLGIGTLESRDRFWYVHRGQTLGFRSNLWYSPLEEITYVELLNGRSSSNLVGALLPTYRRTIASLNEILGSELAETLVGEDVRDFINAFGGDDTVAGGLGDDQILGGDGDDVLRGDLDSRSPQGDGGGGNDIIFGGAGNDRIGGKSGNDILSGDTGDDFIWGDDGDDFIMGGTGDDVLVGDNMSGGSGSDLFVFGNGDGTDTILDFEVGTDRIGLVEGELTFADLTIVQAGGSASLGITSTGETIAILQSVQALSLTESSFAVVPDASIEGALALVA